MVRRPAGSSASVRVLGTLLLVLIAWPGTDASAARGRNRGGNRWGQQQQQRQGQGQGQRRFQRRGDSGRRPFNRGDQRSQGQRFDQRFGDTRQARPSSGPVDLRAMARTMMQEEGFNDPNADPDVAAELQALNGPATSPTARDERSVGWIAIDNPDSTDRDQVSWAERLPNGDIRLKVGVADLDAIAPKGSALDRQAQRNMTSIYPPGGPRHMRPDRVIQLASLDPGQDRLAMVKEMVIAPDGSIRPGVQVYQSYLRNQAGLNYEELNPWLAGTTQQVPASVGGSPGLAEQLRLQNEVAQRLRTARERSGTLDFANQEFRAVLNASGRATALQARANGPANDLIAEIMIAANTSQTAFLRDRGFAVIERTGEEPPRWENIRDLAARNGVNLPRNPDRQALDRFLDGLASRSPEAYQAVSPAMIRMLKRSEFRLVQPGAAPTGHWAMGRVLYGQGTAPLRRYLDAVTQHRVKAALAGRPDPYTPAELQALVERAVEREYTATQVERRLDRSAAADALQSRIGESFMAGVTSVKDGSTFVMLLNEHAEGMLRGAANLQPGDRVRVRLDSVDPERGYLNFTRE